MKLQSTCFVLGAVLALTAPAWAQSKAIPPTGISTGTQTTGTGSQTTTGTGMQTTAAATGTGTQTGTGTGTQTTSTSAGAFQNLSPGGQKIAQSLYGAQNPPTGATKLTLDQIAALKGKEGWGRVFKEMKADGLVQAKNLGQVVSGHARVTNTSTSTGTTSSGTRGSGQQASTRTGSRISTAMNGSGRSTRFASAGGHGGGRYASGYSPHYMSGPGMYAGGMHGGMPGGGFPSGGFPGGGFNGGGGGGGHGHGH